MRVFIGLVSTLVFYYRASLRRVFGRFFFGANLRDLINIGGFFRGSWEGFRNFIMGYACFFSW